jgi:hypothetical protein
MTFRLRKLEGEGPKYFARKRESWADFARSYAGAREVAGRLPSTGPVPQRAQDSGRL